MTIRQDLTGNPKDGLKLVAVICHRLKDLDDSALAGILGTIDFIGSFLTQGVHRADQCQTWLSHFAMILQFHGDDTKWIMQRDGCGVELFPCHELCAFDWNLGSIVSYDGRTTCMTCNVAFQDNDWPNEQVTRGDVHACIAEQREMGYHMLAKNCQHFCYDFYKYRLHHTWIAPMAYESFSGMIQHEWSKRGGWSL
jgi:hypothetical protein